MPDHDPKPICVRVPQVIGVGECQVIVVSSLTLSAAASEIKRVTKTVSIDDWTIDNGKVLIDGTVHKNVEYERADHVIGSDGFDVHFQCCLEVPGATSGDVFQLESGAVCVERDELMCPPGTQLMEKQCVELVGKVTREVQISICPFPDDVCSEVPVPCDDSGDA